MRQSVQQKRLLHEVKHLAENPTDEYKAGPLSNDMHTWHFTLRGPPSTEYEDGIYHGRITFPFDYPLSPPDIYFLNKSGRFEINTKICLTITGYHAEQWNASWTVRSMLEGIISMFPEKERVMSVGSMNQSIEQRKKYAAESWNFTCEQCGNIGDKMKRRVKEVVDDKADQNKKNEEIVQQNNNSTEINEEQLAKQQQANDIAQMLEEEKKVIEAISAQIAKGKGDKNGINSSSNNQNVQIRKNSQSQDKNEQIFEMNLENQKGLSGKIKKQEDQILNNSAKNDDHQFSFEWIMNGLQETVNVINSIRPLVKQEPEIPPLKKENEKQNSAVIVEEPKKKQSKQPDDQGDKESDGSSDSEEGEEENNNQKANEEGEKAAENDIEQSEEHKNKSSNEILKELQALSSEEEKIIERGEALKKIKKLDFLIFITFVALVAYITFTLQLKLS